MLNDLQTLFMAVFYFFSTILAAGIVLTLILNFKAVHTKFKEVYRNICGKTRAIDDFVNIFLVVGLVSFFVNKL